MIFDSILNREFNSKHLAVILKTKNDKATFIVMPLMSVLNEAGVNKIN